MSAPIPQPIGLRLALQEARLRLESSLARLTGEPRKGNPESISGSGRALAQLAALPLAEEERGTALERAALPLPAALGKGETASVAQELRDSLTRSGLFYEAHLRAWNSGEFALEDLRREPQARFGELRSGVEEMPSSGNRSSPDTSPSPIPVPRELERLVREQLATLETKTAVVPLVAWPGQEATLTIGREEERTAARPSQEAPPAWRATLALRLPRLGEVKLTVAVRDELVNVQVRSPSGPTRRELAAHAGALQAALQRNALVLERMELADDGR